jgi:hypothetical protein
MASVPIMRRYQNTLSSYVIEEYSSLNDVTQLPPPFRGKMESFFLGKDSLVC